MKMTTSKIAELAGVSRGAVDKTIHGRPGVRPEIRARILRVMDETGYVPLGERKKAAPVRDKTIAVVLPRLTNPYFVVLQRGLENACRLRPDLHLEYYPCDSTDIHAMLTILDRIEESGADAILFRGVRSTRIRERLNALGKPVIFFDSEVPGAKRLCFIGEDCIKTGRLAASLLAKSIGAFGQVAVVTGMPEISSHQLRLRGFLEVMRTDYPEIEVVEHIYSQDQNAVAYDRTRHLLREHPALSGICNLAGCSGEIGQAILDQSGTRRVKMVCCNTADDVIALIRRKVVDFCVSLAPLEQGRLMIQIIDAYLSEGISPAETIYTPVSVVLDQNLDSLIEEYGDPNTRAF